MWSLEPFLYGQVTIVSAITAGGNAGKADRFDRSSEHRGMERAISTVSLEVSARRGQIKLTSKFDTFWDDNPLYITAEANFI